MTTITNTTALAPQAFFDALAQGALEIAPAFVALIEPDAGDPDAIRLSLDRSCDGWFAIPRALVASLVPLGMHTCDGHQHVLAQVQLNAGTDAATRGLLRLLVMQRSLFERLHVLATQAAPRVTGACQACINGCHGLPYGDFLDCGTACMNGPCQPTHLPPHPLRHSGMGVPRA